ncbi:MAG: TlpA family protein disulfide reductase [Verrucomicrobiota bacterium]
MSKLRDKLVLIYFCAYWYPPCVREHPKIKSLYDQYHKQMFKIVGIPVGKSHASFDRYNQRKKSGLSTTRITS